MVKGFRRARRAWQVIIVFFGGAEMKDSELRAIFFDAGNTLVYPRLQELAEDLTGLGYPATVEDFAAAERVGKHRLDEWLWPHIRDGRIPSDVDRVYWTAYLHSLMNRLRAPEREHLRLIRHLVERFRDITFWSQVMPETPGFLASLRSQGYYLGVISNSLGTMEEQLQRVGLAQYFEVLFDSGVIGIEKPNPRIFRMALGRVPPHGIEPGKALFVGDTYSTDIGGAQLAGIRGVLIDRVGAYANANLACPRITSLAEVERVLSA